jgi:hypothetical protein
MLSRLLMPALLISGFGLFMIHPFLLVAVVIILLFVDQALSAKRR